MCICVTSRREEDKKVSILPLMFLQGEKIMIHISVVAIFQSVLEP